MCDNHAYHRWVFKGNKEMPETKKVKGVEVVRMVKRGIFRCDRCGAKKQGEPREA